MRGNNWSQYPLNSALASRSLTWYLPQLLNCMVHQTILIQALHIPTFCHVSFESNTDTSGSLRHHQPAISRPRKGWLWCILVKFKYKTLVFVVAFRTKENMVMFRKRSGTLVKIRHKFTWLGSGNYLGPLVSNRMQTLVSWIAVNKASTQTQTSASVGTSFAFKRTLWSVIYSTELENNIHSFTLQVH